MSVLILIIFGALLLIAFLLLANPSKKGSSTPIPDEVTDESIKEAALNGEKILAIKWYRELHQVDLKTAKDAVDQITRMSSSSEEITDDSIKKAALNGEKILAIKWYRELHRVDLKTAKDAVDQMTN